MSIFVAGTDTEVGKTVICALLMARYGRQLDLGYWKPIATGASTDRDVATVARLAPTWGAVHSESYRFDPPLSPHLAARLARTVLDPERIVRDFGALKRTHPRRHFLVEGIGGVMVPLTDDGYLLVQLTRRLRLPCVLVARSTLGTINHTLLSLEALRRRKIPLAGVILNGPKNRENKVAIERFGDVPVVGEIETMANLTASSVTAAARRIDRHATLKHHLT